MVSNARLMLRFLLFFLIRLLPPVQDPFPHQQNQTLAPVRVSLENLLLALVRWSKYYHMHTNINKQTLSIL